MLRELLGKNTGDTSAREMASAFSSAAERMRLKFNELGGSISKLDDWGMAQYHDAIKVGNVTPEKWVDFIWGRLKRERMIDNLTGHPMSDFRLKTALAEVYETLRTGGANKLTPSGRFMGKAIANRRTDARFLIFKDADSWIEYQDVFGRGDVFDAMMGHLDSMARDIGLMQTLGPNPAAMKIWLEQRLAKEVGISKLPPKGLAKLKDKFLGAQNEIDNLYRTHTGELSVPVSAVYANIFGGMRNYLSGAMLGRAVISALGDVSYGAVTSRFNELPAMNALKTQIALLNPKNKEDRKLAIRLGLVADHWSSSFLAQSRYTADVTFSEIGTRFAATTINASGLSAWTQAAKHAFGLNFLAEIADHSVKGWGDMDVDFRAMMQRNGINERDWDVIRSAPMREYNGVKFLDMDMVRQLPDLTPGEAEAVASKVFNLLNHETTLAVPEPNLRTRSMMLQGTRAGTVIGELWRSALLFKSFSVHVVATHGQRTMAQPGAGGKVKYASAVLISSTLMGIMALQLKQIASGKDPRPYDKELIGAGLLQGGGLGIFGDFLTTDENRFGGGLAATAAGPVASFLGDTVSLTAGNIIELLKGEDTNFGKEMTDFARRYTPGQSLWYADLAADRLLFDKMQEAVDPKAKSRFRKKAKALEKNYGQEYYWKPGRLSPERPPDLTKALEERE